MLNQVTNYDVKCMLCSAEVGQILNGKFSQIPGATAPMQRKGGMLRCPHCGGSLYLDPLDVYPSMIDRTQLRKMFSNEAA